MSVCFEKLCLRCKRSYTWRGKVRDDPGCPKCARPASTAPEDRTMPFGKYRNKTLGEIADADILYLDWLNDPERKLRDRDLAMAIAEICAKRSAQIDAELDRRGDD